MNSNSFLQFLKKKLYPLEQIIFYLLILFLPTQLGKHFWPQFSYILGIRIDYLSPTIYLTDILLFTLFLTAIVKLVKSHDCISKIKNQISKTPNLIFLILIIFLFINIGFSKSPLAGVYGLVKLLEFIFFGFYVSKKIKNIEDFKNMSVMFALGIIFESLLSISQYFSQSSIGSIFYFFGERTFSSQTPGIANVSLNVELVLRPYGTFSHPNVLAAYLIIGMTMVLFNLKFQIFNQFLMTRLKNIVLGLSIVIGSIAIFLTMSRVAIILWIFILGYFVACYLKNNIKNKFTIYYLIFAIFIIGSIFLLSPIHNRFTSFSFYDESIAIRKELVFDSLIMIKEHLLFGVGINNFLINLPYYQKINTGSFFTYLQPVHNIFLLMASETGIAGFIIFVWFIIKTLNNILKKNKFSIFNFQFSILIIVIILGFFDHYFLTLQQGQLLFFLVLGFCWSKIKIDSKNRIRDNKFNK